MKFFLIILIILIFPDISWAIDKIDLNIIAQIESTNDSRAFNKESGAIGLYQITDICLADYNLFNQEITKDQLFKPEINRKIAEWYINIRIPELLKSKHKVITVKNILICYNAGIKLVDKKLSKETSDYIQKYFKLRRYNNG